MNIGEFNGSLRNLTGEASLELTRASESHSSVGRGSLNLPRLTNRETSKQDIVDTARRFSPCMALMIDVGNAASPPTLLRQGHTAYGIHPKPFPRLDGGEQAKSLAIGVLLTAVLVSG